MRLGSNSSNEYIQKLNKICQNIQNEYQKNIEKLTQKIPTKVMLGDSTVTEQQTFDPGAVNRFYEKINLNLKQWSKQGISIVNDEGLRRIFTKLEIHESNYQLSIHFSLQFHVLLYYKPDLKIIEYQKELAEILEHTKEIDGKVAEEGNRVVEKEIKTAGYENLDEQKLFEILYDRDELSDKISKEIEQLNMKNEEYSIRKTELLKNLDQLLVEIYQTTSVLIDDNRLVTGEEGCLCNIDLEFVKQGVREGIFDPKRIPDKVKDSLISRLNEVCKILKQ